MLLERPETFRLNKFHPLASGLVFAGLGAHAGSTRYHDSSVYGNTGTLTNMTPATDWVLDTTLNRMALQTDGAATNYALLANGAYSGSLMPGDKHFSLSLWLNLPAAAATANANLLGVNQLGAAVQHFQIGLDAGFGDGKVYSSFSDGTNRTLTGPTADLRGTTSHICAVGIRGDKLYLYVNGVLIDSDAGTTSGPIATVPAGSLIGFGAMTAAQTLRVADGCIWHRAISHSEIRQLADPSNVMLSGLIQNPQRKWWPVVSGGTPATFKAAWLARQNKIIGGGVT